MQEKFLEHFEILKSCIRRTLDDIYNTLDATEQANISDERTDTLKAVAEQYEELLKNFVAKKELSEFEIAELAIIVNQTISNLDNEKGKVEKTLKALKEIGKNLNFF